MGTVAYYFLGFFSFLAVLHCFVMFFLCFLILRIFGRIMYANTSTYHKIKKVARMSLVSNSFCKPPIQCDQHKFCTKNSACL